jgi:hypothetical protein
LRFFVLVVLAAATVVMILGDTSDDMVAQMMPVRDERV